MSDGQLLHAGRFVFIFANKENVEIFATTESSMCFRSCGWIFGAADVEPSL
jgi:hypothetical protein